MWGFSDVGIFGCVDMKKIFIFADRNKSVV